MNTRHPTIAHSYFLCTRHNLQVAKIVYLPKPVKSADLSPTVGCLTFVSDFPVGCLSFLTFRLSNPGHIEAVAETAPVEAPQAVEAAVMSEPSAVTANVDVEVDGNIAPVAVSEVPEVDEQPQAAAEPAAEPVAEVVEEAEEPVVEAIVEAAEPVVEAVAETPVETVEAVVAEPAPVEASVEPESPADTSGLTDGGRATNDPREAPKPVGELLIETGKSALFKDDVAPPVVPSGRVVTRASNDPRSSNPAPEAPEAAAQS